MSRQSRLYKRTVRMSNKIVMLETQLQQLYAEFDRRAKQLSREYNTTVVPPKSQFYNVGTQAKTRDLEGLVKDGSSVPQTSGYEKGRPANINLNPAQMTVSDYGMMSMWLVDETELEIQDNERKMMELKELIKEQIELGNEDLAAASGEKIAGLRRANKILQYELAEYKALVQEVGTQERYSRELFNGLDKDSAISALAKFVERRKVENYEESQAKLRNALRQRDYLKSLEDRWKEMTQRQITPKTKEGQNIVDQIKLEMRNEKGEGYHRTRKLEQIEARVQKAPLTKRPANTDASE